MLKPTVIDSKVKKISKIYHVSDIHIRNFKRHDEYRRVFEKLVQYIDSTKTDDSIICVTGDIVHSKTDITPELVQETQNFLKLMSSLLPTIVIPGNHDTNLNNDSRLDTLTPIINAMSDKNITYIKDTGVYKMANIDFVHWSVFDDIKKYVKSNEVDSDLKICMYHGPVNNAITDENFALTGNKVNVSDFDGFHIVLLGDIHKRQFLNENKTIAYPGSLIQQNHGEQLDHGILVWDLKNTKAEYISIENDTAFYTLYVENGIYEDIPNTLPKNLHLRLRIKNTTSTQVKEIVAEISKIYNIVELSQQTMSDFHKKTLHTNTNSVNVRNIDYQNELLSKHLKSKFSLEEQDIINICELNRTLNSKLQKTEITRNVCWNLKRFEFSNMFSYGEGNVIDFTNMEGIYGIFASNASGKSSSIEALLFCLFDKCSKTNKASQVMNNKSNEFSCKVDFELDEKTYTIQRKAFYKSNSLKQEVDFYSVDKGGNITSLNGNDRFGTDAKIREVIGSYEDFVLTSMSMQNNNTGFIDMSQSERKDLLSQFLDIKIYEDLHSIANEEVKEYSILLKEYKKIDYFEKLTHFEDKAKNYAIEYRELEKEKDSIVKKMQEVNEKHAKLSSKIVQIDSKILNINLLESQKESLKNEKIKIKEDLKIQRETLDALKIELTEVENRAQIIDLEIHNKAKDELQRLMNQEKEMSIQVEKLKTQLTHKLEKMKKLEDLKYDENCKFCMDNVFVKDAIATRDSIETDKIEATSVIDNLKHLRQNIEILKKAVLDQEELYSQVNKKKNDITKIESNINRYALELHQKDLSIKEIDDNIEQYKKKEAAIKSNQEITEQLNIVQLDINSIRSKYSKIQEDLMTLNTEIQLAHKEIDNANKNIEKLKLIEVKYKYYEKYLSAVGRDGLPYEIVSTMIPKIESDVNAILSQMVNFGLKFESDGKNINAFINYGDNEQWPIELSSGMEKFISTLAIRTSLINMTSLPKSDFLVVDEGFGALDQSNVSNISKLMDYLKTQFKYILMISHIDSIRDVVDSHIEIIKEKSGFSKVIHT